ncbi:MAG: adenosine deaminase family protein, partial [Acidobacteria bacterium]|nr:adenosine deaminase family protein [Acidobacteriota bacterium]
TLISAMRQAHHSDEMAHLAVEFRDSGVCGFDIAGPEDGFPPTDHLNAFQLIRQENFHLTIHAGEAYGLPSIWEALQFCGAERLGHGVRIIDDVTLEGDRPRLGRLANYVRDRRIPLEVCPTSNVHTGAAPSFAEHPIELLRRLRFRVTVNTDNRLMSGITLSDEFAAGARHFGWTLEDMEWFTLNAAKSTFFPFDQRLAMINQIIKPRFAALRADVEHAL